MDSYLHRGPQFYPSLTLSVFVKIQKDKHIKSVFIPYSLPYLFCKKKKIFSQKFFFFGGRVHSQQPPTIPTGSASWREREKERLHKEK